ncbi:hypothetical protein ACFXGT_28700 [Streptomyces sp. NPDC059352]
MRLSVPDAAETRAGAALTYPRVTWVLLPTFSARWFDEPTQSLYS